jgi:2-aminobenzoate-CoA ligase
VKDHYPLLERLPADWLVPTDEQPDYLDLPGVRIAADTNLGVELSDAWVGRGLGDAPAVTHHESGTTLTYRELSVHSDKAAAAFIALGVQPGERVLLRGPNHPDLVIAAIGAWKIGAIVVPTPLIARASELAFFLDDTLPSVILAGGSSEDMAQVGQALLDRPAVQVLTLGPATMGYSAWHTALERATPLASRPPTSADSVAVVWHTGGTTGKPKGCYHTHRRFLLAGHSLAVVLQPGPGAVWAAAAPFGHALGFIHNSNFTLQHGAHTVLVEGYANAETVLQAIRTHHVDTFTAISATWSKMLEVVLADPSLTPTTLKRGNAMWQSASASGVYEGWLKRGVELCNNFGSTAFATWVLVPPSGAQIPRASLGAEAPGYVVTAVEPGEIGARPVAEGSMGRMAVRGPSGLTYWRRPALQTRDVREGWTLVDDLISYDKSGMATYLGRTDFMVSTAGYKVAPVEVEAVLARHPGVREVAVIGVPDQLRQEVVAAFVCLETGWAPSDKLRVELQNLVKRDLAPYKYPRRIDFIDALPRDHVGKVMPRRLRQLVLDASDAKAHAATDETSRSDHDG